MDRNPPGTAASSSTTQPLRVSVCAATFRRPDGLRRLLQGLAELQFPDSPPAVSIIIVDNDPAGSAQTIVESVRNKFPWPIQYVHEPSPGIVAARNAALDALDGAVEFVCFLDDDESPNPDWLHELLVMQRQQNADVVTGPVISVYETGVPNWIIAGRFFQRREHPSGAVLPYAATNNVLFRAALLDNDNLRFDPRYQPMGEDQAFFRRIALDGGRLVWANNAVVREWIPADRARAGWLIHRMYYIGQATTRIEIQLRGSSIVRVVQLAKGIVWIAIALITIPLGLLARRWAVRSMRWFTYGCGLLRGLF